MARRILIALASLAIAPAAFGESAWVLDGDTLSQTSSDTIKDEYATKDVHPKLEFVCEWGEMTFRIDWGRFISSFNTEVGFSVDGGSATWLKLSVDSSNKMTLGNTGNTRKLIELLGDGDALNVEVAPYSEPAVNVNFDLAHFADGLGELKGGCA